MKNHSAIVTVAFGLALGLCAQSVHAAIVTYTDRSSWTTASGGGSGYITDNLNSGSKVGTTITRTGYTITGTATAIFPNSNAQTTIDGTGYVRVTLNNTSGGNSVTFTFSSPIRALGYDLNPQGTDLGAAVSFAINGTPTGSYTLPASDVNGFQGFVSTTSFTSLTLTTSASTAWHGIDNLEAFSAVPEPMESALMTGLGLGAFVLVRRRLRR